MEGIKASVKSTFNKQVLGDIGNFGGLFTLNGLGLQEPVLVSSVHGMETVITRHLQMRLPSETVKVVESARACSYYSLSR